MSALLIPNGSTARKYPKLPTTPVKYHHPYCDGMIRRDFLRVGATSLLGMQFGLTNLLAQQARAAKNGATPRDVSLIFIFLKGGLSTIDTFDLKPDAPSDVRGEFNS